MGLTSAARRREPSRNERVDRTPTPAAAGGGLGLVWLQCQIKSVYKINFRTPRSDFEEYNEVFDHVIRGFLL